MSRVLIVDDEPAICWGFRELLAEDGHDVQIAPSAEEGLQLAEQYRPDAVILDVRLPGLDGLSAIEHFRQRVGDVPIIVITAFGNLDTAVRAIEQGAFDYLPKPFDLDQVSEVVRRALRKGSRERPLAVDEVDGGLADGPDAIIGQSQVMQQVFKKIALASRTDVSVLITGESGTGKELVAKAIHRHSLRSDGPFVPVCLPALSPNVIESELFGHVRGAFTGADSDRKGLLELAHGGTVFLDEIGDVPLAIQVKLLRAIEHREVVPVGDARPRRIDFRVIVATHQSLPELIAAGRFREDLYYRLSVFQIELPPLRDRREDIPVLAEYFLRQLASRSARAETAKTGTAESVGVRLDQEADSNGTGRPAQRFTDAALRELMARPWYGNVRELRNAVEHAAVVSRTGEIGPEALPEPLQLQAGGPESLDEMLRRYTEAWTVRATDTERRTDREGDLHRRFLRVVEPILLQTAVKTCHGNRAAAARLLGIHRATLRQKLRQYGLETTREPMSEQQ